MFTAQMIPDFDDKTVKGALAWWNAMLRLGFFIHPEDDPADIINVDTNERSLDDAASIKVSDIYEEMIVVVGYEETYDAGMTAYMNYNGWVENETRDGWIEAATIEGNGIVKTDTSWCHKTTGLDRAATFHH